MTAPHRTVPNAAGWLLLSQRNAAPWQRAEAGGWIYGGAVRRAREQATKQARERGLTERAALALTLALALARCGFAVVMCGWWWKWKGGAGPRKEGIVRRGRI